MLCTAMVFGDRKASEDFDISRRSIQRYRERLGTDDKLRQMTTALRQKQTEKWLEELPDAISSVVAFIKTCAQNLEPYNPDNMVAATKALEVLFDVKTTQTVIEARLGNAQN